MRDGTIKAASRQGVDELGMALKAFPDAIQAHEPGTIFSPTQGEIADDRRVHPSPSEIARDDGLTSRSRRKATNTARTSIAAGRSNPAKEGHHCLSESRTERLSGDCHVDRTFSLTVTDFGGRARLLT
jgi:hypothetical protein